MDSYRKLKVQGGAQKGRHTNKAVAPLFFQHLTDVTNTTDGELIVVELVSRCSSCIHDIIALLLLVLTLGFSWGALRSRVMLRVRKKERKKNHRLKEEGTKCASP